MLTYTVSGVVMNWKTHHSKADSSLQCLLWNLQTMQQMNKVMDPQKMQAQMNQFTKESMKMGMTEEMSMLFWIELILISSLL